MPAGRPKRNDAGTERLTAWVDPAVLAEMKAEPVSLGALIEDLWRNRGATGSSTPNPATSSPKQTASTPKRPATAKSASQGPNVVARRTIQPAIDLTRPRHPSHRFKLPANFPIRRCDYCRCTENGEKAFLPCDPS